MIERGSSRALVINIYYLLHIKVLFKSTDDGGMHMNINTLLRKLSKIRSFEVDQSCFERVLHIIREKQPLDLWEIMKYSDEYFEATVEIVHGLTEEGFLRVDKKGRFRLTQSGEKLVRNLRIESIPEKFKSQCKFPIPSGFRAMQDIVRKIRKEIKPKTEYEQGPLTLNAALRKVAFAISKGDILNKNVICVGDDDVLSLILALTGLPRSITVIDIDEDILNLIKKYAEELKVKVPIKTYLYDLKKPVPKILKGKFDTFLTQPPDTVLGFTLFVSRGVEFLKARPGMIGYAGLTTTGCPLLGLLEIQKNLTKMNLLITDILSKFCHYLPGETEINKVEVPEYVPYPTKKIWYIADLIRVKTTKNTKPLFKGEIREEIGNYERDLKYQ